MSSNIKPTNQDLMEFAYWLKSKPVKPKLRSKFRSDKDYEDFMMETLSSIHEFSSDAVISPEDFKLEGLDYDNVAKKLNEYLANLSKQLGLKDGSVECAAEDLVTVYNWLGKNPEATYEQFLATDEVEDLIDKLKVTKSFGDREKVSAEDLEKAKNEGVVQKKPNGSWGIISIQAKEWWVPDYKSKESAEAALAAYHANKFESLTSEQLNEVYSKVNDKIFNNNKIKLMKKFSLASSERFRIKRKDGVILSSKFATKEAALNWLKDHKEDNKLQGAKVWKVGTQRTFSENEQKEFSEGPITVDKDPTILQDKKDKEMVDSALNAAKPKDTVINFDNGKPFFMSVEPWIATEVISDSNDGIYAGTIKGSTISAGDKVIDLAIKLNSEYPDEIIAVIKGKKIYIWKLKELIRHDSAKIFSVAAEVEKDKKDIQSGPVGEATEEIEKEFSDDAKIYEAHVLSSTSPEEGYVAEPEVFGPETKEKLKEMLEKARQQAKEVNNNPPAEGYHAYVPQHVGYFDNETEAQETAQQWADDMMEEHKYCKSFSVSSDEEFIEACHKMAKDVLGDAYSEEITEKTAQGVLKDQEGDYDVKLGIFRNGIKGFSKSFSDSQPVEYGFEIKPGDMAYDMDHIIGTLLFSVTYAHLFHLISSSYAVHKALDEYYNDMPDKVDALAEAYLAETNICRLVCCITPSTSDPIDYLSKVKIFLDEYSSQKEGDLYSNYQSLIDDCTNLLESTLYKLKRLNDGNKTFSFGIADKFKKGAKELSTGFLADLAYELVDPSEISKVFRGYNGRNKEDLQKYIEKFKIEPMDFLAAIYSIWQFRK